MFSRFLFSRSDSTAYLAKMWSLQDYEKVYTAASNILDKRFLDNAALTYKGYSGFYMAVGGDDPKIALDYLDSAIISLRLAMVQAKKNVLPQIEYMLGKSYFYKDTMASYHYYADLSLQYLLDARRLGYKAQDIPEYLGLSYASLGMTNESIAAFTEALLSRESDVLLLAIAQQYYKNHQYPAAKQYLSRVETLSENDDIKMKAYILLGNIALEEEDYDMAKDKFSLVLDMDKNSADSYYGLGVVYEKKGDLARARSMWRTALRLQNTHAGASQKIAQYR